MIVIKIQAGFGNQLFQYALYKEMQARGKEVFLDTDILYTKTYEDVDKFTIFPNASFTEASKKMKCNLLDNRRLPHDIVRRRIFGQSDFVFEEDYNLHFQDEIFGLDKAYLIGYWQCEKYFKHVQNEIHRIFCFDDFVDDKNKAYADILSNQNSVSVHVRRGDYLQGRAKELYGGICTEQYYSNSINYLRERYSELCFYIFTNDVTWAKEYYKGKEFVVVDINSYSHNFFDMYLMSKCKYNIIANSSFSWWGAWLNTRSNKEVLCPSNWFNLEFHDAPHILCGEWTKV